MGPLDEIEGVLKAGFDETVAAQPMKPTRDREFYPQLVIFQVGNVLFQVPKKVLDVPGSTFEDMFALPPTSKVEGSSDENPIRLLEIDENHFRSFLRVVCGSRLQKPTDKDWLKALELAKMWNFAEVQAKAVQALDGWSKSQSLKQVIFTAKKFDIVGWLKPAYTQFALQDKIPFDELTEHPAVDWETIARLFHLQQTLGRQYHARDDFGTPCRCSQCGTGRLCCGYVPPGSAVETIFEEELKRMKDTYFEDPPAMSMCKKKKKK